MGPARAPSAPTRLWAKRKTPSFRALARNLPLRARMGGCLAPRQRGAWINRGFLTFVRNDGVLRLRPSGSAQYASRSVSRFNWCKWSSCAPLPPSCAKVGVAERNLAIRPSPSPVGKGIEGLGAVRRREYPGQDRIHIRLHFRVRDVQNRYANAVKQCITRLVIFDEFLVYRTIHLYHQARRMAVKIGNDAGDQVLPSEVKTSQSVVANSCP